VKSWLTQLFRRAAPPPAKTSTLPEWLLAVLGPVPEEALPDWSADNQARLLTFLRSDDGRLLLAHLRAAEEQLKTQACDHGEKDIDHARGRAVGYRQALASIIIFSASPPQKEDIATEPSSDAARLRETLSH
jgi:hypothetical protein